SLAIPSIICLASGSFISSAIARASFARSRQCLGSLIRDADVGASRQAATASCWRAASQASNTSTISPVVQRRLVIRPPSRALSAASTAPLELRLCLASFRGMMDFVFKPPLRLAREVAVRTLDDAAEFARTYVGPRLPHRRDRIVRRLEEVSDDASARIAAQAFRAWAIAEGLLAEES